MVPSTNFLQDGTVPSTNFLLDGTVPANNSILYVYLTNNYVCNCHLLFYDLLLLDAGTVPASKKLNAGTVPASKKLDAWTLANF